jgi:ComF family protein
MDFKNFILDLLFPKFCFGCKKEGSFLCQDCLATIDIFKEHRKLKIKFLDDLFVATEYKNFLVKRLILALKYEPFAREIAKDLANLIKIHFKFLNKKLNFSDFILIPIPLSKKKLKWRGFNQAEEIGKDLSRFLKIPLISNCLIKIKKTLPQVILSEKERRKNLKGVFQIQNEEKIKNKKILLVDDVFTTGTTLSEAAKILKNSGAKKVIGLVVAIAKPDEDKLTF